MALRPPQERKPRRRRSAEGLPDSAIAAIASALVIIVSLRLGLIAIGVEPWTAAWNVIDVLSTPLLWPFDVVASLAGLERTAMDGRLGIADIIGSIVYALLAAYLIAVLTVRPHRA